jgi:GR25 family glycosyltransferase involved in LPS biosynthesis
MRRPEATKKVISIIKKNKFKKIYIVCDGWRNESEKSKVLEVRKIIDKSFLNINVKKIYFNYNVGMRNIAPVALKKIFKIEKKIIILEDDTLPHPTFFKFIDQLLIKYKSNNNISMISGSNLNTKITKSLNEDYFFSKYTFLWGWGTWKNRWKTYDNTLKKWPKYRDSKRFKVEFPNIGESRFWKKELNFLKNNQSKGAWDFPLSFANYYYRRLAIVPKINLIKNIGYSDDPTGINPRKTKNLKFFSMPFKLSHPKKIIRNLEYDKYCSLNHYYLGTIVNRIKNKILKIIRTSI